MHKSVYLLFVGLIIFMSSCRKDFDTVPSQQGNLAFSKQTVYLDTVFTDIGSSTYMLKVYNRTNKDISIPSIHLAKPDSKYRLMVDGMTGIDADQSGQGDGRVFPNVELLAKDSLFIFIETTVNIADANPTDFLYTDEIVFESVNGAQQVNLVTLIQDAVFLYPEKDAEGNMEELVVGQDENGNNVVVTGFQLNESDPIHGNELIFTNEKPYVIYGFAGVPSGKTLQIQPGARVHFHADSGILVQNGGTLNIGSGWTPSTDPEKPEKNEVIFEGDRLEPGFSDTPGQWFSVWLQSGSTNTIDHLILKNAVVGILADNAPLTITNSQIYNSSKIGIAGRAAGINGTNLAIATAGQACFATIAGGSFTFQHCTFNNNWGNPDQFAVLLSNYETDSDNVKHPNPLTQADFKNCIIYGTNNVELYFDQYEDDSVAFVKNFQNCLVKFRDAGTQLETDNSYADIRNEANGNKKNLDPKFLNANNNKHNINDDSPAHNAGIDLGVPTDILGRLRTSNPPDIGAYQSAPFPD